LSVMPDDKIILNPTEPGGADEAFERLTARITDMAEFEALNAIDRRMFEVFLEFWNQNVYSKFVYITESNDRASAARCLELVESVRKILAGYTAMGGHLKHPPSPAYPNLEKYKQVYAYFENVATRRIPLTRDNLKLFSDNVDAFSEMFAGNDAAESARKLSEAKKRAGESAVRPMPSPAVMPSGTGEQAPGPPADPTVKIGPTGATYRRAEEATKAPAPPPRHSAKPPAILPEDSRQVYNETSGKKDYDLGCFGAIAGIFIGALMGSGYGTVIGFIGGIALGGILTDFLNKKYKNIPGSIIASATLLSFMIGLYGGFKSALISGVLGFIVSGMISDWLEKNYLLPLEKLYCDKPAQSNAADPADCGGGMISGAAEPEIAIDENAIADIESIDPRGKINKSAGRKAIKASKHKFEQETARREPDGSPANEGAAATEPERRDNSKVPAGGTASPISEHAILVGIIGMIFSCYISVLANSAQAGLLSGFVSLLFAAFIQSSKDVFSGKK